MCFYRKKEKEIVSLEETIKMQAMAKGFRSSFYIIFNSFVGKNKDSLWDISEDCMSSLGTLGCFSIELYLKLLQVFDSYDESNKGGKHNKFHDLKKLYQNLNKETKKEIIKKYKEVRNTNEDFEKFIKSISNGFVDWRYSYEQKALNVNLNILSDVLNVLNYLAEEKFRKIHNKNIGGYNNKTKKVNYNQIMSMNDIEKINKEDYLTYIDDLS